MTEKNKQIQQAKGVSRSPTPLYHQIYLLLRDKIISGELRFGERVPSEHQLVALYSVSRITAKRALDELAAESLVTRHRGQGTLVKYERPAGPVVAEGMRSLMQNMLSIAQATDVQVISLETIAVPLWLAADLELTEQDAVQHAVRVRYQGDAPFSCVESYVPGDIASGIAEADLVKKPLLALIEQSGHILARATQAITAVLADNIMADRLQVKVGCALLKVRRIVFDTNDRPVEYINIFYRPDLYQLNVAMARSEGGDDTFWSSADLNI